MPWPFSSSTSKQQPPQKSMEGKKKRVTFADPPSTKRPQQSAKQVRFTPDTKPGSRHTSSDSSKTRWPCTPTASSAKATVGSSRPGLSSIRRDFDGKRPRPPPAKGKVDVWVSAPMGTAPYCGTPKPKHLRPGSEWVSFEIRVTPTGKDWRREKWAAAR